MGVSPFVGPGAVSVIVRGGGRLVTHDEGYAIAARDLRALTDWIAALEAAHATCAASVATVNRLQRATP